MTFLQRLLRTVFSAKVGSLVVDDMYVSKISTRDAKFTVCGFLGWSKVFLHVVSALWQSFRVWTSKLRQSFLCVVYWLYCWCKVFSALIFWADTRLRQSLHVWFSGWAAYAKFFCTLICWADARLRQSSLCMVFPAHNSGLMQGWGKTFCVWYSGWLLMQSFLYMTSWADARLRQSFLCVVFWRSCWCKVFCAGLSHVSSDAKCKVFWIVQTSAWIELISTSGAIEFRVLLGMTV